MSFPNKEDRKKCWDNRDAYWTCLDTKKSEDMCTEFRKLYEQFCPSQWVKHFDKRRGYLVFKEKLEKEGFAKDIESQVPSSCSDLILRRRSFHAFSPQRFSTIN
ncbi:hypothetical protein TKK_0014892 [Trichogramma kaykai]|uniref:Cytochrome c oxidase assembly factor 6 homolog n=1 Tax=Trichogramma kaykai TaxID=54128 RepID=A0ABD2WBR9_9HYME